MAPWPNVKPIQDIFKDITHPMFFVRKRMKAIIQKDVLCIPKVTQEDFLIPTTLVTVKAILEHFALDLKVRKIIKFY